MKKYILPLCMIAMHDTSSTSNKVKYFTKQPLNVQQVPQLSQEQISQLNYLDQRLHEFGDLTKQEWTHDENVRILIERTELAIIQSSPSSQPIIKQKVKEIMQDHGIEIDFTSENIIRRPGTNYLNSLEDFVENFIDEDKKKPVKKKHRSAGPTTKKNGKELPAQKSISGKRRTLNKLKRDAIEAAKNTAAEQAKQRALDAMVEQKRINEAAQRKELIDAATEAVKKRYEAEQEEQRVRQAASKRSLIASPQEDSIHVL